MDEFDFLVDVMKFMNSCAGEGIGQTVDGKTIWADDLLYKFLRELELQRKPFPAWIPEEIKEEWET